MTPLHQTLQCACVAQYPYTRLRRVIHTFAFIRNRAAEGPAALERTQSFHVAQTYGVEQDLVKRIKARFRNELSFGGDGE